MVVSAPLNLLARVGAGARQTVQGAGQIPFNLKFLGFVFFLSLYLLFQAGAIFGEQADHYRTAITMYLLAMSLMLAVPALRDRLLGISTAEFFVEFLLWGVVGVMLVKLVGVGASTRADLSSANVGLIFVTAFVVAVGEEIMFRLAPLALMKGPPLAVQGFFSIVFGFFHWGAYGNTFDGITIASFLAGLPEIMFATMLGFVFGVITISYRRGFIAAMALHAAYNLAVLGFVGGL